MAYEFLRDLLLSNGIFQNVDRRSIVFLQTIMLFSALGIPDDVILRKQEEYYRLLARSLEDEDCALKMLLTHDEVRRSSAALGAQRKKGRIRLI